MKVEVIEAGFGLHLVLGPRTNWCLLREGDAITLVDAAWPRDYPLVIDSLTRIGAKPAMVEAVVLTHAHPDHIGVAEQFRSEHGATIHTHRDERGHATGEYHQRVRTIDLVMRMWRPSVFVFAMASIRRGAMKPAPASEIEVFGDSPLDVPGGLVPIPTPGHTSGHAAFHLPDHGVLITGDALVNENLLTNRPGPRLLPRIFNHDLDQAVTSLDRLSAVEADVLLPGHGKPIHMTPAEAVTQAKRRLGGGWWDR